MNHEKSKILWLTYVVLITALISTVTLSRYMTSMSGARTLTAAKFDVTMKNLPINDLYIQANETKTVTLVVKSNSDISVRCNILVTGLPAGVTLTQSENNFIIPSGIGQTKEITLTFTADSTVEDGVKSPIVVKFNAEQNT